MSINKLVANAYEISVKLSSLAQDVRYSEIDRDEFLRRANMFHYKLSSFIRRDTSQVSSDLIDQVNQKLNEISKELDRLRTAPGQTARLFNEIAEFLRLIDIIISNAPLLPGI